MIYHFNIDFGGKSFSLMTDDILIYLVPCVKTTGLSMTVFSISIFVLGTTVIYESSVAKGRSTSIGKIISITQPIGNVFYVVN